ncbi:MAG: hypothetical protein HP002_04335 [Lentisphaeria bacterium]|nr:hypothetical protein [Lentisphaeria bacterium]
MASYNDSNWRDLPDHYRLKLDNVGSTAVTELMPGEYVGNGDNVDFRQITVAESGLYSFHFYNLTNPAELTVYAEENGRLRELEDEDGKRGENIILDPVRLYAGRTYYIAVRPEGISHQQGASYTVGVTRSGGGQSPGGEDDVWTTAPRLVVPGSRQKVDMDLVEDGFIGGGDEIDFRRVTFEKDGTYTIKLDDLRGSAKLTLYRVTGGGIVEVASVTGGRRQDGVLRNLDIGAGEYVLSVEPGASGAPGTGYEVEIEGVVHSGSGNNADDTWLNAPAITVAPDAAGSIDADLIENDWVGYDDLIDCRKLDITEAGVYRFTLDDLDGDAKLTLYTLKNGRLKKLKTASGKAGRDGVIANQLLEGGTYYLSVEASGRTKKGGTEYDVDVSGTAFTKGDTSDDDWRNAPEIAVDGGSGRVDRTLIDNGWIGYGDLVDYREVTLDTPGIYRFELDDLDGDAKLTLCTLKNGKLKKLKTASGKAGRDGVIRELLLDAGTYYVAVEASGRTKKGGTDYDVEIIGSTFTKGDVTNNDFSSADELPSGGVARGWVGFGDASDYYRFSLDRSGFHDFALAAEKGGATLTIYREIGGKMKVVRKIQAGKAVADLELDRGTYYLQVQSGDKGKGKKNTDYEILTDLAAAPASLAYEPLPGITESVLTAAPDLDFGASALEAAAPEGWRRGMPALA